MGDIDTREAELLARLEAEREQRVAEKIAAGEIVSVPLYIVAGSESEARTKVEAAKAAKLAELHDGGDRREVVFATNVAITGVLRPGEAADPGTVPTAPSFASPEDARPLLPSSPPAPRAPDEVAEEVREAPEPVIETYIAVQIGRCEDGDVGQIEEGWYSVAANNVLTVTNSTGGHVGSAPLKGQHARVVAKRLLRDKLGPEEAFNRRLAYPDTGLT
jgi:hypothetical protein